MVKGLDLFREQMKGLEDRYALIGGTACELLFIEAGVDFRSTKDLDIVLWVEALDAKFARAFWRFVERGGYETQETSTGERRLYRFKRPKDAAYPAMLELFSRAPDALRGLAGPLTPLPIDEEVASLSAILLDDAWYQWIHEGTEIVNSLPVVGTAHLIALKATAWNDLRARRERGEEIHSTDVKKHRNDVFRLFSILDPNLTLALPDAIARELRRFLDDVANDPPGDLKAMGLGEMTLQDATGRLRRAFGLA